MLGADGHPYSPPLPKVKNTTRLQCKSVLCIFEAKLFGLVINLMSFPLKGATAAASEGIYVEKALVRQNPPCTLRIPPFTPPKHWGAAPQYFGLWLTTIRGPEGIKRVTNAFSQQWTCLLNKVLNVQCPSLHTNSVTNGLVTTHMCSPSVSMGCLTTRVYPRRCGNPTLSRIHTRVHPIKFMCTT